MIENEIDNSFKILRALYCNINLATFSMLYKHREKEFMKIWAKTENIILFLRELNQEDREVYINWIENGNRHHNTTIRNLKKAYCVAELVYEKITMDSVINDQHIVNIWKTINNIPKFISIINHEYLDLIKKWAYNNILIEDIYKKYTTIDNILIFQSKQTQQTQPVNVLVKPTINIVNNNIKTGFSVRKKQLKPDKNLIRVRDINELNKILNH